MKEITVNENDSGQRLDKFISKYMPKLPASMLYKGIRKNCVKINGKHAKKPFIFLNEGDVLSLYFKDEFFSDEKARKRVIAYGGRPSFYFNTDFYNLDANDEARRKKDMLCDTDENLRYSVSKIKEAYDLFKEQRYLQLEFMESYECDGHTSKTTYSDGSVIIL